jgi:hypothetical protein
VITLRQIRYRFWSWVHRRAEDFWHWVYYRKVVPLLPKETVLPGERYFTIGSGEMGKVYWSHEKPEIQEMRDDDPPTIL